MRAAVRAPVPAAPRPIRLMPLCNPSGTWDTLLVALRFHSFLPCFLQSQLTTVQGGNATLRYPSVTPLDVVSRRS
ncbi:hypothetical protein BO94DRAFT_342340 [Aspergillus sclerotioniger CBS 115572]|uniref:Uncharacterized protein n=1 Tax=Aspergillus sclerotioniger CBS 115572 TaxID=1450535 RepID=A0A317XA93_9EURO|nr:hypothetical protein BO94DRAFT_342340 [Aspergillus sclerotioniger CBS 115572]PWY93440.1 hypothetical protein BO94DRAFT_342340 [Aspergillus sclerotioniger CBS 115572]